MTALPDPIPERLEQRLRNCRELPSFPAVAARLVEMAREPDVEMGALARMLAQDPALAAKLLRVAASPLYASKRRVENLRQALTILGLNATLNLSLGFSLGGSLKSSIAGSPALMRSWRRSVMSAVTARALGEAMGLPRTEELMLSALLQDIGCLALAVVLGQDYLALLEEPLEPGERMLRERELAGADHKAVGAWLARQWRFPEHHVWAIARSGESAPSAAYDACVALSGPLADLWTDALGPRRRAALAAEIERRLALPARHFHEIEASVGQAVPDIQALFEVTLLDPAALEALQSEAEELRQLRLLIDLEQAMRLKREAEALRDHARDMEERANHDPLTGLPNRAHFFTLLQAEFQAATDNAWPLSLAFVDLDDFKGVNDRFGHLAGDQVLSRFATALRANLRASDVVARFGGEEFLILLPGTDERAATTLLARLVETMARTPMAEIDGEVVRVTASIGLAFHGPAHRHASAEALVDAADRAVLEAKSLGRNRLVRAAPPPDPPPAPAPRA